MKKYITRLNLKKVVGTRLYNLRNARGYNTVEFAAIMGISRQAITKYERGDSEISVSRLFSLASALDVEPEYFIKDCQLDLIA